MAGRQLTDTIAASPITIHRRNASGGAAASARLDTSGIRKGGSVPDEVVVVGVTGISGIYEHASTKGAIDAPAGSARAKMARQ
jgi:hypothetical protein